jgi:DUF4097 and DUF4098 domain-containing protein YvlB
MKRGILALVFGIIITGGLYAQEYKVAKSTGRLEIREVNNVSIEGYNGNEIIFTSRNHDHDDDGRSKGLRAISSLGLEDNTGGLGLSVLDKGNVIEVQQLKKTDGPDVKIMVPKGITISYTHSSPYGDEIEIKNFEGAIEISTVHNGVILNNTTGALSIKTVHGDIEASLPVLKNAAVLESVHGHVDVALPLETKANLELSTNWGEILVDPAFKLEIDKTGGLVNYSDKLRGKLNGGGVEITLSSHHNNVYLRKK